MDRAKSRRVRLVCASILLLSAILPMTACGGSGCEAGRHYATYTWDSAKWTRLGAYGGTETAEGFGYDPDLKTVISVGGGNPNDTFKWTGHGWQSLNAPACCAGLPKLLAYDYSRNRMLLFGDDVYAWSGHSWDRVAPGRRLLVGIAYDVAGKQFVALDLLGETEIFDGASWTSTSAKQTLTPLMGGNFGGLVYDPEVKKIVAVGLDQDSGSLGVVAWDGTQWTQSATKLPSDMAANGFALGYDPALRGVLFSGLEFIWLWNGTGLQQAPGGDNPRGLVTGAFDTALGQLLWIQESDVECAPGGSVVTSPAGPPNLPPI